MRYCQSCKYFVEMPEQLTGECRWLPLIYFVEPKHWCGQYKQRDKDKPEKVDSKPLVLKFADMYKKILGAEYTIDWIKDSQAAKTLLKENGEQKAIWYFESFLSNPPDWNKKNKALGLRFVPMARNQISLKSRVDQPAVYEDAEAAVYGNNSDWPDYIDYRRKGGKKQYSLWASGDES